VSRTPTQRDLRDLRHRQIREVLRAGGVHNQTELQERLAAIGVRVEQATISRDLHAIGVVKGPDGYLLPDAPIAPVSARVELVQLIRQFLTAVDCAGQIVVLRTGPGRAQPLGLALDNTRLPNVLGTIAGDDTIFVATPTIAAAERFVAAINAVADGADASVFDEISQLDPDTATTDSIAPGASRPRPGTRSHKRPSSGRNGQQEGAR